jgi:hypothetical protein
LNPSYISDYTAVFIGFNPICKIIYVINMLAEERNGNILKPIYGNFGNWGLHIFHPLAFIFAQ